MLPQSFYPTARSSNLFQLVRIITQSLCSFSVDLFSYCIALLCFTLYGINFCVMECICCFWAMKYQRHVKIVYIFLIRKATNEIYGILNKHLLAHSQKDRKSMVCCLNHSILPQDLQNHQYLVNCSSLDNYLQQINSTN